jgi:hypothetical protein
MMAGSIIIGRNSFASSPETPPSLSTFSKSKSLKPAVDPLPDKSFDTILPLDDFLKLSLADQQLYLHGAQSLILELQAQDISNHILYGPETTAQTWWLPEAVARERMGRCVFAGWISQLNERGYCQKPQPQSRSCGPTSVPCQPALFGLDANGKLKCFPANANATSMCAASASPAQVAARYRTPEGRQAWADLRANLKGYCDDPQPNQKQVCLTINNRLLQIATNLGRLPKPRYPAQPTNSNRSAETRSPRADARSSQAPQAKVDPEIGIAATRLTKLKPALKKDEKVTDPSDDSTGHGSPNVNSATKCQPAALLANMVKAGDKDYRLHSYDPLSASNNLMSLDQAKGLVCGDGPIEPDFIKYYRSRIDKYKAIARSNPGGESPKERLRNKADDERNYSELSNNFEACLSLAQENRKKGLVGFAGHSATVVYEGSQEGYFALNGADGKRLAEGPPTYYEQLFITFGISICNVQTKTTPSSGPRQSQGSQAPVSSAPSAQ